MGAMVGNIDASGNVTLTSGSLASWIVVSGSDANGDVTQVFAYGTEGSGNDWTSYLSSDTTLSTITDSMHFKVSAAPPGGAVNGVKIVVAQQWLAASQKWWQNVNYSGAQPGSNPASLAAGYFGSDGQVSVDLRPAGAQSVLWLHGDTSWATAAGQHQFGAVGGGSSFIHQSVGFQTIGNTGVGPQLASDAMAFNNGLGTIPSPILPAPFASTFGWIVGSSFCGNANCLLITCLPNLISSFQAAGGIPVFWIKNPVTAGSPTLPVNWQVQQIPNPFGFGILGTGVQPFYDPGDGFVYSLLSAGLAHWVGRWPKTDLQPSSSGVPSLMRPQVYVFGEWLAADLLTANNDGGPLAPLVPPVVPEFPGSSIDGTLSAFQKADGTWVFINDVYSSQSTGNSGRIGYFNWAPHIYGPISKGGSNGGWNAMWDAGFVETGFGNAYTWQFHPEQKWSGQSTDDVCFSYACNAANGGWPRFGRVSGL